MRKIVFKIFAFIFFLGLVSCTEEMKTPPPPIEKYQEDTTLMLKILRKFASEHDINRLYTVAVATQQTRPIPCADYNGECSYFGETLAEIIRASSDGNMSASERMSLERRIEKLRVMIDDGTRKLKLER